MRNINSLHTLILNFYEARIIIINIMELKYYVWWYSRWSNDEIHYQNDQIHHQNDQMLDAIRYVSITNEKVEIKELSLGFFQNKRNKATDFTQEIWKHLEIDDLDINDCHAQKYGTDNGVFTMVGKPWSNILTKGHYSMDAQVTLLIFLDSIFSHKTRHVSLFLELSRSCTWIFNSTVEGIENSFRLFFETCPQSKMECSPWRCQAK